MDLYAGTSGFSYKAWKGSFYPDDLADAGMLRHYAERLPAVEINNTFYRMPRSEVVKRWAREVPVGFRFVIKASQRITHRARLKDVEEPLGFLWRALAHLGEHLGPILFQLPPYLRKDVPRVSDFLASLPEGCRAVMEFRHESWFDDQVHEVLRGAGAALCMADDDKTPPPELVATTDWGYLRLRRADYDEPQLARWVERIRSQPWDEAWVFFKHEDGGVAPRLAAELLARFEAGP